MRLFFLSEFLPRPDTSAGDRRLFALLELLAARHELDLCLLRDESRPETLPAWETGDHAERAVLRERADALPRYKEDLLKIGVRLMPFGWKHVGAALASKRYDVGIFEYYWTADVYTSVFRRCQPGAKVICDSVDICYARTERGVEFGQEAADQAAHIKQRELGAFRAADAVITVSSDDDALLRSLPDMPPSYLVPVIVPVRPRAPRLPSKECLFVGGFKHYPNVDGVLWFVEKIWGLVRQSVPDAVFTIVGTNPPAEILALAQTTPGVQVVGYVPDTNPFLDRCAVSVAPLRWGGGMKGKVTEAVACGVPVVTTSIGAQGFKFHNGEDMAVADDPAAYAAAVIALLREPAKAEAMGLAGQERLAGLCSPRAVAESVEGMLREIAPQPLPSQRFSANWFAYRSLYHAMRTVLGSQALSGS